VLETGKIAGNRVVKISFGDDSEIGKEEICTVTNEKLGLFAGEKPILVLYKELPAVK
jgi:hypothetical protein